jgi:hypothetical protein
MLKNFIRFLYLPLYPFKIIFIDVHDSHGITIKDLKTVRLLECVHLRLIFIMTRKRKPKKRTVHQRLLEPLYYGLN